MKHKMQKWIALLLAVVIALAPVQSVWAESADDSLPFVQVSNATAPDLREPVDTEAAELYAPEDQVRVSIVLESASTLERGFATAEIATDRAARAYRAGLQQEQQRLTQAISRQALSGEALDVVWNLTLAANLISANVAYGQIEAIEAVSGVREVILETRYEPTVYSRDGAQPNMSTSQEMIGTAVAYAADYTGAGMRIAVIDTGTDTDHQSFDAGAFDYAIAEEEKANGQTYDLLDAAEISAVLTQLNAYKRDPSVTAEALYGTTKLPFNYNYVDGDYDVTHDNDAQGEHGSHVAGIAVANRYVPTEDGYANALEEVLVQGVAPDAQLITMKVFGKTGGAYDSDYMAAIEDAILLGCDAINLSLGSVSAGFATNQTYQDILDRLADTDTVLAVSAGNSGAWADGAWNGHLYSEDVNFDTVGAPGSYTNTFTVASADNVGYTGQYLSVADRMMFYLETEYYAFPIATLAGQTFDYVLLDGIGDYGAWDGIDLTGKVAVCFRGEISFSSKAQYAADAGAAAIIICNNEPGSIYMDLSYYYGDAPCVSLGQEDGAWMLKQGTAVENENGEIWYYTGQVTVSSGMAATVNSEPITMSSFSSWGVPGTLELKPEITAPGGNIYSVNGLIPGGESYETMSGTSMAAPQIAGMSALVAQYIQENDLAEQTGLSPRVLTQSLLMSTAQPLTDATSGSYYPVIQQGAGLANVGSAVSAGSYVLVEGQPDGKVKAELGDDPERTGVYSFTFTLNNLTDAAQDYLLSAELFTQDLFEDYASNWDKINAEYGSEYHTAWYLSKTTAALDADVAWTVDGAPVELQPGLARMDFDGNGVIDRDDAQALLDYASGNRSELSALTYADLGGSGDVTTYDAYLFLRGLNGGAVTLPANGKMEITVTMTLTEAQKQALDAQYPSGAYVQGYICAAPATTAEGVMGVTHSIPVLAFYGNWSDASMFEVGTWLSYDYDVEEKQSYMGYVTVNYVTGLSAGYGDPYVWGGNLASFLWYNEDYLPERATLNNLNGDSLSQYVISPIRNAAAGKMEIVDVQTGEVYKSRILDAMSAEFYYTEAQQWYQTEQTANLNWFGTDANGEPLPEGTQAEVRVTLASEYYVDQQTGQVDWSALGAGATLSTLVTIDNTAPVITGVAVDPLNGTLTVTAQDNQYVAAVSLNDPVTDNGYGTKTPNQQTPGETVRITYEYLEYFTGDRLQIVVYDYAANMTTYEVMVGEIFGNEVELTEFGMYHGQYWYLFNHDSSTDWATYDIQNQVCSLTDLQAAADVDGKVFLITKSGELYVQDESLTGDCLYICKLNAVVTDLAYNPADGMLYGVSEADGLVRIDLLTGDCEAVGMPGVPTGTLACDQTGTFYCMSCEDNGLYRFTLDTLDAPELLGKFEYSETWMDWETGEEITETEEYGVNGTEQSLEWSCNDGMLYWAQYHNPDYGWVTANFLQIDLTTLECTQLMDFLSDAAVALFVRDTDRSGKAQWTEPVQQDDRIELSTSVMSMKVNEEAALTASVLPWTAADRNVIWSSSDSSVAIVDENGSVKALSAGSCTITATSVLSPEVTASCKVTVEQVELSLKGAVSNENGQSKLFTWAIGQDSVWTPGAELDFFPASAAYVQQTGALYLQGTDNSLTMYQVDESSGETLAVSGQALSGIPAWDMAACEFIGKPGEAVSIYGPYIGSPSSLAENAQVLYGFDFSYYLMMVTNCTSFVAVASGGYESVTVQEYQEDGTLADQSYDGERLYLLDAAGYLWIINLYAAGEDAWGCVITALLTTDLTGKLPFLRDGDFQYCSMVEDRSSGDLVLSYFTGDTNELYLLYSKEPESTNLTAVRLGDMGDRYYPAALYSVESNGKMRNVRRAAAATLPLELEDLSLEQIELTALERVPGGTLNATAVQPEQTAEDGTIRFDVTVPEGSNSGLVAVNYDPDALELVAVNANAELTSLRQEEGSVTIGFADLAGLSTAAVLSFTAKEDGPDRTELVCSYLQQNELTGTTTAPVDSSTVTLELRCPSEDFEDLDTTQWYHEGVDFALANGLMLGMSDTEFAPNGQVTRAQLVTILYRLEGKPSVEGLENPFEDVAEDAWYAEAVIWAANAGVVKGVNETTFAPNTAITREQIATILFRYAGVEKVEEDHLKDFNDADKISAYAVDAMNWAVAEGLVKGMGNATVAPGATATRVQIATVLARFCEADPN